MPIYEYECLSCGERFDELQKFSDPPVTECKLCKGKVRKLLGTPALQFKGSGWYITDYAGKTPPPNGNGGSDKPAEAADSGTAAGTAKPEAGDGGEKTKTEKVKTAPACKGGSCADASK